MLFFAFIPLAFGAGLNPGPANADLNAIQSVLKGIERDLKHKLSLHNAEHALQQLLKSAQKLQEDVMQVDRKISENVINPQTALNAIRQRYEELVEVTSTTDTLSLRKKIEKLQLNYKQSLSELPKEYVGIQKELKYRGKRLEKLLKNITNERFDIGKELEELNLLEKKKEIVLPFSKIDNVVREVIESLEQEINELGQYDQFAEITTSRTNLLEKFRHLSADIEQGKDHIKLITDLNDAFGVFAYGKSNMSNDSLEITTVRLVKELKKSHLDLTETDLMTFWNYFYYSVNGKMEKLIDRNQLLWELLELLKSDSKNLSLVEMVFSPTLPQPHYFVKDVINGRLTNNPSTLLNSLPNIDPSVILLPGTSPTLTTTLARIGNVNLENHLPGPSSSNNVNGLSSPGTVTHPMTTTLNVPVPVTVAGYPLNETAQIPLPEPQLSVPLKENGEPKKVLTATSTMSENGHVENPLHDTLNPKNLNAPDPTVENNAHHQTPSNSRKIRRNPKQNNQNLDSNNINLPEPEKSSDPLVTGNDSKPDTSDITDTTPNNTKDNVTNSNSSNQFLMTAGLTTVGTIGGIAGTSALNNDASREETMPNAIVKEEKSE